MEYLYIWNDYNRQETFQYPYDNNIDIRPTFSDKYYRDLSWLILSLAHFADLVLNGDVELDNHEEQTGLLSLPLGCLIRLCNDALEVHDFAAFEEQIKYHNTKQRMVIDSKLLPETELEELHPSLPNMCTYDEVLLFRHIDGNKWIIFHLSIKGDEQKASVIVDGISLVE